MYHGGVGAFHGHPRLLNLLPAAGGFARRGGELGGELFLAVLAAGGALVELFVSAVAPEVEDGFEVAEHLGLSGGCGLTGRAGAASCGLGGGDGGKHEDDQHKKRQGARQEHGSPPGKIPGKDSAKCAPRINRSGGHPTVGVSCRGE